MPNTNTAYNICVSIIIIPYTNPEKPIKAVASKPAVINAIGAPFIASGTSANSNRSLMLAIMTNARKKPKPPPNELKVVSNKP